MATFTKQGQQAFIRFLRKQGTADEVQAMTEQIINTIESLDLPVNITEDTWEDENT